MGGGAHLFITLPGNQRAKWRQMSMNDKDKQKVRSEWMEEKRNKFDEFRCRRFALIPKNEHEELGSIL